MTGAELPKLKGIHKDHLRVYACKNGKLEPIPFQVDERTPELEYCWTKGPEPVKDVDDGRLDDDDEVVFRAADAGDRSTQTVEGATGRMEVELEDPLDRSKGWAYVLAFDDKERPAPERSSARHVEVLPDRAGGALLRTDFFEVASTGSAGLTGRPTGIRFRSGEGVGPEIVRDAAKLKLHASYLFARIDREGSEARTSLGSSYIEGPVRIVAPVSLEAYLIWGNWISSSRSYLVVHDHTFELHARFSVPVSLDRGHASEARLSIERGAAATGWHGFAEEGLLGLSGKEGSLALRLELDPRLRVATAPGTEELTVDLTALKKSDEPTPYEATYVLAVLPEGTERSAKALILSRDKPLKRLTR